MLKIAWDPQYVLPLPPTHRFPMSKYEMLPQQLMYEGTITRENLFSPDRVEENVILRTHDGEYWDKLKTLKLSKSEIRKTGFPLSQLLVDREVLIMSGTLQATEYAREFGIAMNIAGGTHHAFTDRGEGFCLLNDIAIAANELLRSGKATKIAVIDLDVHQGNGTAQIFQEEPLVFTFSMHGANNYPLHKEQSDWDIALPDKTTDREYLGLLEDALEKILSQENPDFIFFQSGVDVLETDKLGRLGLSIEGCKERDRLVLTTARKEGIPLVASMGGGYAEKFRDIIEAHANTYRLAQELYF